MRQLRIGTTNFQSIRKNGDYYADKTEFLYKLVNRPDPYFLSRPRRFGKTLLVDTLMCILRGQRELFKGLWIDGADYDWTPYPVIMLEMNGVIGENVATMQHKLSRKLIALAKRDGEEFKEDDPSVLLEALIELLYGKYNQTVAILIDEYDAPILEYIDEPTKANKFRDALSNFYGMLKTSGDMIGHIFITGVSRFTKASIFSKLNNLKDITLNEEYAAICGFTEAELEDILSEYQDKTLARLVEKKDMYPGSTREDLRQLIHDWYDGYSWDGKTRVFNPWSLLNFLDQANITNYWLQSGSTSFLSKLGRSGIVKFNLLNEIPNIDESQNFIDDIALLDQIILLFQSGYLTIKERLPNPGSSAEYRIDYPNLEVKSYLVPLQLSIQPPKNKLLAGKLAERTRDSLLALDIVGLEEAFGGYLAQYPHGDHIENEKYYQTLLESALLMAGQRFWTQESTVHGNMDIHLNNHKGDEYIIEVKLFREKKPDKRPLPPPLEPDKISQLKNNMNSQAKKAFKQISERYAQKFLGDSCNVVKIALVIARISFVMMQFKVVEGKWS
jgi:hypothetical protein